MHSFLASDSQVMAPFSSVLPAVYPCQLPRNLSLYVRPFLPSTSVPRRRLQFSGGHPPFSFITAAVTNNFSPPRDTTYTVGDFMTKKEDLHVVMTTTSVDHALETLVEKRITGFPVIDDDWKLVGVISDYDLLALDSISGGGQVDTNMFPDVDSSWKAFNEIQKLLSKTNGKVVGELMTPAPLTVHITTSLGDAVRLLIETKYHRLPVVDGAGRLVGIITRGNVVRAALQIKRAAEKMAYHHY